MAQVWKRYTWINNHLPFWANLTSETCQIFLCETMNSHQMNVSILFTFKLFTTHVTRSVEMQLHVSVKLSRKYYCTLHISMVNDHRGFNELHQEVWHHSCGLGHCPDHLPCSDKSQNLGFLRKSIFLILGGP